MHPSGAVGESGRQRIQRNRHQKEQEGRNREGHGSYLITDLLYCMGEESDVEEKNPVTVQLRTLHLPKAELLQNLKKISTKRFTLAGKNVIVYVIAMSSAQAEDGEMAAC